MGAVESPCASSDIIAWKRLDNCDVCKGDTKDRLAAARAGFEALSGVEASSGLSALNPALTSQQRRVIENAIEHWCMTLSTGNGLHLLVDGCERLVRLNPNPLALVVEDHGTFPLACMERVEIPSAAWPNSECLISFTATSAFGKCSLAGGEGASLRFTFSRREECMEFALSLRSLQVLTPDLHGQFHTADGGDSSRTSASSARSHGSISLRGSGRSGNVGRRRKRQTSKQRGKNCSPSRGAGPFTKSSLGVQPLLSSAELRKIVQQEDDAPKPSDSPSGRKMKPGFVLESLRSASTASLERSREVRSPPPIRNSPLHLLGGAASELRGDSDLSPAFAATAAGIADTPGSTPRGVAAAVAAEGFEPAADSALVAEASNDTQSSAVKDLPLEPLKARFDDWGSLHRFRRARLAALIGPCPG